MSRKQKEHSDKRYFLESDYHTIYKTASDGRSDYNTQQTAWHISLIGPQPGEKVLDVGAGSGRFVLACLRQAGIISITGMDISRGGLNNISEVAGKKDGLELNLVQADAEFLPFADASFDKMVCVLTSQYVPHPEALHSELGRVCRKGGSLLIDYPNGSRPRVYIESVARTTLNACLPALKRLKINTITGEVFIVFSTIIKSLFHVRKPVKYLDATTIRSIFAYGATPYHPRSRKQIMKLLEKHGFTEYEFFSAFGTELITVLARKARKGD